jgi:hypothetical protein
MARALKDAGNEGNVNKVGDFAKSAKMGDALLCGSITISSAVTANTIVLPEGAKAYSIIRAYASAGTVTGHFTSAVFPVAPATTQVGISATGDILFFATDAVTRAEVEYVGVEGNIISATAIISAGLAPIPSGSRARLLLSASAAGATRVVLHRGVAPAVTDASIAVVGTSITFNVADNGKAATFRYVEMPAVSIMQRLTNSVDF